MLRSSQSNWPVATFFLCWCCWLIAAIRPSQEPFVLRRQRQQQLLPSSSSRSASAGRATKLGAWAQCSPPSLRKWEVAVTRRPAQRSLVVLPLWAEKPTGEGGQNTIDESSTPTSAGKEEESNHPLEDQIAETTKEKSTINFSNDDDDDGNGDRTSASIPTTATETATTVSVLLLNAVALLWGSQHAVIKTVVDDTNNPAAFTLLRFGLAACLASAPSLLHRASSSAKDNVNNNNVENEDGSWVTNQNKDTWRWGLEMGFWMFLGFGCQAIGLEFTTAQRSGFLLYLNVKFVPFLAWVLLGRPIRAATWASAFAAFAGTALLAWQDGGALDWNVGDAWTVAAAAASAMFILRLERASAAVSDAAALNAACLWVVALLSTVWTVAQLYYVAAENGGAGGGGSVDAASLLASSSETFAAPIALLGSELIHIATAHPLELIYLGGVTTAFCNWLQTKAQRNITAERASVIYAMDPVYGAGFAYLLLGETFNSATSWLGAGMITVAAATNAFLDVSNTVKEEEDHLPELLNGEKLLSSLDETDKVEVDSSR